MSQGKRYQHSAQQGAWGWWGRGVRGVKASVCTHGARRGVDQSEGGAVAVIRGGRVFKHRASTAALAAPPPYERPDLHGKGDEEGEGGEGREGGDSSAVRYIPECLSVSSAAREASGTTWRPSTPAPLLHYSTYT